MASWTATAKVVVCVPVIPAVEKDWFTVKWALCARSVVLLTIDEFGVHVDGECMCRQCERGFVNLCSACLVAWLLRLLGVGLGALTAATLPSCCEPNAWL